LHQKDPLKEIFLFPNGIAGRLWVKQCENTKIITKAAILLEYRVPLKMGSWDKIFLVNPMFTVDLNLQLCLTFFFVQIANG